MGLKKPTGLSILFLLFVWTSATSIFPDTFLETGGLNNEPEFAENIKNVTVPSGREAILSCVVNNLGKYKVGWIRAEDQTILTLDTKVVTHNSRVTVTHDGSRTWNLHLRQVRQNDRGCYMCQINTAIMRKQLGCIDVHVSPNIIDGETSSDLTVREGDNATLVCRATGHPPPRIIWKREDGEKITMRRGFRDVYKAHENITGDNLQFVRLDRRQMGTFLCIATNEVPPAVSKRITLDVNFTPVIKVTSQLLGAPFGTDVVLECQVESCPKAFIYWMKNRGEMLIEGLGLKNSTKYLIEETRMSYKTFVKLTVIGFQKKDVGIYNCMAANSMGKAEASIRLHEIKVSKSTSSATENQVVTSPGFATPPMSTEMKGTGGMSGGSGGTAGGRFTSRENPWNVYDSVSPRDSVSSARNPNNQLKPPADMSNTNSSPATSPISLPFILLHLTLLVSFSLVWGRQGDSTDATIPTATPAPAPTRTATAVVHSTSTSPSTQYQKPKPNQRTRQRHGTESIICCSPSSSSFSSSSLSLFVSPSLSMSSLPQHKPLYMVQGNDLRLR